MKETKSRKENRTFTKHFNHIKYVRESIKENTTGNLITDIHDSADAINDRLATIMNIDDKDFVITLTRYGLWVEWEKNLSYGVSVEAYGRSVAICGWYSKKIISKELCDESASRAEIARLIDRVAVRDGKL